MQLMTKATTWLHDCMCRSDVAYPVGPRVVPPSRTEQGEYQRDTNKDTQPGDFVRSPSKYLSHLVPFYTPMVLYHIASLPTYTMCERTYLYYSIRIRRMN